MSISDFGSGWPYLDTDDFSLVGDEVSKDQQYWSSNDYVGVTVEGKYVRVVRGDEYRINDFADNGDETITDEATGLMWARATMERGWTGSTPLYTQSPIATDSSAFGPAIDDLFSVTETQTVDGEIDYGYDWTSTSAHFRSGEPYHCAWYVAAGRAADPDGFDSHGAGAVRFDTKTEEGPDGEDGARVYNFVRLVREVG